MGTHCSIGYCKSNDPTIRHIYCHYDGYTDNMCYKLFKFYDYEKIQKLIKMGDIKNLEESIEKIEVYNDTEYEISESFDDWIDKREMQWCEFFYLLMYDEGNFYNDTKWVVYETSTKEFHKFWIDKDLKLIIENV